MLLESPFASGSEADATELQRRLGQHLRDIALAGIRNDDILTLRRICNATKRWDRKKNKFSRMTKSRRSLQATLPALSLLARHTHSLCWPP